ncbi:hypothetical protein SNOG_14955 [Parastagonospora nodorum SN15]|uniref:Uncharacterized protein n=1 Tax=Phaeosphaeria nodorum (strain SN15 / ATCC MYA-4574 / FGSC 10173) TaxID=321614 RepID=Q0U0A0_PHANO|nr:hypothetical protein SNOG_14955 [Parastagonospora nodorum SN15]EAT77807.1 hypothetical protein SNOG_14955 [Parastagonospora nodorum SN15]
MDGLGLDCFYFVLHNLEFKILMPMVSSAKVQIVRIMHALERCRADK